MVSEFYLRKDNFKNQSLVKVTKKNIMCIFNEGLTYVCKCLCFNVNIHQFGQRFSGNI